MTAIPREDCRSLSVADFYSRYMLPNRPVLINVAALACNWRSHIDWVISTGVAGRRQLNSAFISSAFGDDEVTVHNCSAERVMGRLPHSQMKLHEFLADWEARAGVRTLEETGTLPSLEPGEPQSATDLLYLKDWNFAKEHPEYELYHNPAYFCDDWLNEFEKNGSSDHRFVYLGPAGTFTPLHKDVLNSFSWSVNVMGRKRWWMLPPQSKNALHKHSEETGALEHIFDLRQAGTDGENAAKLGFPALEPLLRPGKERALLCFDQNEDEVLFVPSGWWHQVLNLQPTLSINHNWLNAANVQWSWRFLVQQRAEIGRTVPGCEDSGIPECSELAQTLLEIRHEWNYESFLDFLEYMLGSLTTAAAAALQPSNKADSVPCKLKQNKHVFTDVVPKCLPRSALEFMQALGTLRIRSLICNVLKSRETSSASDNQLKHPDSIVRRCHELQTCLSSGPSEAELLFALGVQSDASQTSSTGPAHTIALSSSKRRRTEEPIFSND